MHSGVSGHTAMRQLISSNTNIAVDLSFTVWDNGNFRFSDGHSTGGLGLCSGCDPRWKVILLVACLIPVPWLLTQHLNQPLRAAREAARQVEVNLSASNQQWLDGLVTIGAFGLEEHVATGFDRLMHNRLQTRWRQAEIFA
ncbi:MAG: ABC transporter ATP-binding protein [Firmicutes bacterium]|nr:ABC transporter ATP-binding protein [Bacillota bacterium]